jgi:hypothetical protein
MMLQDGAYARSKRQIKFIVRLSLLSLLKHTSRVLKSEGSLFCPFEVTNVPYPKPGKYSF